MSDHVPAAYAPLMAGRLLGWAVVWIAAMTLIGVAMGVVLVRAGSTLGGVILILTSVICPPLSVVVASNSAKSSGHE